MKLTVEKKNSNLWEWSIDTKSGSATAHHAGGYSRTKRDAENDGGICLRGLLIDDAKKAGRIAEGGILTIKPDRMDAGDENYTFVAAETQLEGITSFLMRAVDKRTGKSSIGLQTIYLTDLILP